MRWRIYRLANRIIWEWCACSNQYATIPVAIWYPVDFHWTLVIDWHRHHDLIRCFGTLDIHKKPRWQNQVCICVIGLFCPQDLPEAAQPGASTWQVDVETWDMDGMDGLTSKRIVPKGAFIIGTLPATNPHFWRWCSFSQTWDMLVSWSAVLYCSAV